MFKQATTKKFCAHACIGTDGTPRSLSEIITKWHIEQSFAKAITALEKEIQPQQKRQHQDDPSYEKLKNYHDNILNTLTNTTTEKLSAEVLEVILDPSKRDTPDRKYTWSKEDENRSNDLNKTCKSLQPRNDWTWDASDDSERGRYNDVQPRSASGI